MLTDKQVESLNMLGYFKNSTGDFVCGLVNPPSKVVCPGTGKYLFVSSATNTISIAPKPDFDSLVDHILDFQYTNCGYEYFESKDLYSTSCVPSIRYVYAKTDRKSSRKASQNLIRVRSSNVWAYSYDIELGRNTGYLYVQFKNKNGGPGDVYQYFEFPVKMWKKFVTAPSKGHFFWRYVRNNFRYRKLTGDRRGKLSNAIN